jgi:hypothetical protein
MDFVVKKQALVIGDSFQDWLGDSNENDASDMIRLMNKWRVLARAGAGVLLLHHNNASTENPKPRGSTVITNLTDMCVVATKRKEDGAIELRENRFRGCAGWEIDFKIHFQAPEDFEQDPPVLIPHIQIEVLRDELTASAIKNRIAGKQERAEARTAKDEADAARVVKYIEDSKLVLSAETIERKTRTDGLGKMIGRNRVRRLAEQEGYRWDDTNRWTKIEKEIAIEGVPY